MSNSVLRRGKDRDAPRAHAPAHPLEHPLSCSACALSVRRPGLVAVALPRACPPARHRRWRCCCCSRPPSLLRNTKYCDAECLAAGGRAPPAASLFYALTHSVTAKLREQSCSYGRPSLTYLLTYYMHAPTGHTDRPRPFVASKKGRTELREGKKDIRSKSASD